MRAYGYPGNDHAYDMRNLQPVEDYGRKQYDDQHNQEDCDRIGYHCCCECNHGG